MALCKYLKKIEPEDKRNSGEDSSSLSRKDVEMAGREVRRVLEESATVARQRSVPHGRRGKYNCYSPEERASIGKYAAENGATRAAKHFSCTLGQTVNESTARRLKGEYLLKVQVMVAANSKKGASDNTVPVVKSLPLKPQGRPVLLGVELDMAVQQYVQALRTAGVVNTTIVMAAAMGIVSARDPTKLTSHGGHINITKTWAKSLLGRMGYVKRKCSNAGKVTVTHLETIQEVFLADITAQVIMNEIPDELIFNWDQTALPLVLTGQWTMHPAGGTVVPIAHSDDKRNIMAVLAATMTGECLPPQLIYKGKTTRCHPQVPAPDGWDIWHSKNHWSNEDTMKCYIEKIVIPFTMQKRRALKLEESYPALALFDGFRGQTTASIYSLLEKNHIISVLIPANCTNKLQPLDISVNKPMNDHLQSEFQTWYASEMLKQLQTTPVADVKVDVAAAAIKPHSAAWIFSAWQSITMRPDIVINGFHKAGIVDAIASARD